MEEDSLHFFIFPLSYRYFAEINKILSKLRWMWKRMVSCRKYKRTLAFPQKLANCVLIIHTFYLREFPRRLRISCRGKNLRATADCACTGLPRLKGREKYFAFSFFFFSWFCNRETRNELHSLLSLPFQARQGQGTRNCDTLNISFM